MSQKKWSIVGALGALALVAAFAAPPTARASFDSWTGKQEKQVPFTASITGGTPALVMSSVVGVAHNVRAIVITNTASGTVHLHRGLNAAGTNGGYNGTGSAPGTSLVLDVGVLANTPLVLNEDVLGQGVFSGLGVTGTATSGALYVDATTGTVTMQLRVREDPTTPNP